MDFTCLAQEMPEACIELLWILFCATIFEIKKDFLFLIGASGDRPCGGRLLEGLYLLVGYTRSTLSGLENSGLSCSARNDSE